jgi:hypothetical protein
MPEEVNAERIDSLKNEILNNQIGFQGSYKQFLYSILKKITNAA